MAFERDNREQPPATVVQGKERAPHAATVVQGKERAPHAATVVQSKERAPHAATVVQGKEKPPHPATVVQRSRNNFKYLVGSTGRALAMTGGGVDATGVYTAPNGEQKTATGKNGNSNWSIGRTADVVWSNHNKSEAGRKRCRDAEIRVLCQLGDWIKQDAGKRRGGTLRMTASITICTYCAAVIAAFCNDYGCTLL